MGEKGCYRSRTTRKIRKKLDPTLKVSRKPIFAAPRRAQHMYIRTGKIDHLSWSVTYWVLTPSYSRPSKTLRSIGTFESWSSNGLPPQPVSLQRNKHDVQEGSCRILDNYVIRFQFQHHGSILTKSVLKPSVLSHKGQKYVFMASMMLSDGTAPITSYEYCVIV